MLSMKKLLTKLLSRYVTETFYNTAETLSAGTPGSYATIQSRNISKDGYSAIGVLNATSGHPGSYQVIAFVDGSTLYMAFYRVGTSSYAMPANDLKVTVLFKKN